MKQATLFASLAALACLPLYAVHAEFRDVRPAYLHGMSDLKAARWMLSVRPGDFVVSAHEGAAIHAIDAALKEIRMAAIDDGKDLRQQPPVDVPQDGGGRLHRASELLHAAHGDIEGVEEDPMARGLKQRALAQIDRAIQETDGVIWDIEHHR